MLDAPRLVTPSVMAASAGVCSIRQALDGRTFNKRISRSTLLAASHRLKLHKWLVYCLRTADKGPATSLEDYLFLWDLQAKSRADERTRTADLTSLRVIGHVLQGCAGDCKCRIFKRFPFSGLLSVAPYCVPGGIRVVSTQPFLRAVGEADTASISPMRSVPVRSRGSLSSSTRDPANRH